MPEGAFARALAFVQRERVLRQGERVLLLIDSDVRSAALAAFAVRARGPLELRAIAALVVHARDDEDDDAGEAARVARHLGLEVTVCQSEARRETVALEALTGMGWDRLALADTIEDAAARTLRECVGGRALRGLCARRRDGVSRPLLDSSLWDADDMANEAGVRPMNVPPELKRAAHTEDDRMREGILPRIRAEFPGVDRSLVALASSVRRARAHRR